MKWKEEAAHIGEFVQKYRVIEFLIVSGAFLVYFAWSLRLPVQEAPDEFMRYPIARYILDHGRLPIGDEEELIDSIWGFSYAFVPYGASLFSVFFMKIASLISESEKILIVASRLPSVIAGTGTVFLCLKIGKQVFHKKSSRWLFAVLVGYLPQFAFLSAYLNNDAFAVFTCTAIFYYWVKGLREGWKIKTCIGFGLCIGLCALSYYNAYGFILCSIFVFSFSLLSEKNRENKWKFLLKRGGIVFVVAFAVAGWFFIRNFLIHNGDFLGLNSMTALGEQYAQEGYQLSKRLTFKNQSLSLLDMLRQTPWLSTTMYSFFAVFGYMSIWAQGHIYHLYAGSVFLGACIGIKVVCFDKEHAYSKLFLINGLLVLVIPVVLSLYNSYAVDWQAQGRYLMPMLPMLMFFVTLGMEKISVRIENRQVEGSVLMMVFWLLLFIHIMKNYGIPFCTYGV